MARGVFYSMIEWTEFVINLGRCCVDQYQYAEAACVPLLCFLILIPCQDVDVAAIGNL